MKTSIGKHVVKSPNADQWEEFAYENERNSGNIGCCGIVILIVLACIGHLIQ